MINAGMAKEIHLAKWNGNTLVYSIPNRSNPERLTDFKGSLAFLLFPFLNFFTCTKEYENKTFITGQY